MPDYMPSDQEICKRIGAYDLGLRLVHSNRVPVLGEVRVFLATIRPDPAAWGHNSNPPTEWWLVVGKASFEVIGLTCSLSKERALALFAGNQLLSVDTEAEEAPRKEEVVEETPEPPVLLRSFKCSICSSSHADLPSLMVHRKAEHHPPVVEKEEAPTRKVGRPKKQPSA